MTVRERNPALDRVGERKSNPALDQRMKRVRVDHEAGIDGAEHALDRQPPADAGKLRHLRDIGFEPPAAADVAIVGNAPKRILRRGRGPAGCLRGGIEHAQRERIVRQQIAPVGILVDVGALGELADEAFPEEHRRGRAHGAHEVDRDRQRRVDGLHQKVRQPVALIVDAVDHALVPDALGRLVEPALAHRAEQRLAGNARVHRQRIAAIVENRAKAAARVRPGRRRAACLPRASERA